MSATGGHPLSSHLLVLLQLMGIACACYPVGWVNAGSVFGLVPVVVGTAFGLYTLLHNRIGNFGVYPELKDHAKLVTTGPYAWARHPMYVALVTMMMGITIYNGHWLNLVGAVLVSAAVAGKALREEGYLQQRFGDQYTAYAARTRAFGLF